MLTYLLDSDAYMYNYQKAWKYFNLAPDHGNGLNLYSVMECSVEMR